MQKPRIPVVMYHSINRTRKDWLWNELICDVDLFHAQIAGLKARGFRPTDLDEVRDVQERGAEPDGRPVVITLDDGYLDNWVYAYPLLKRQGWKGVVYVNPDFIDPGEEPRPNLEDVWEGRVAESDLQSWGFLNRAELRRMDAEGVITVASHSRTHTWYPTGRNVEDFHRPGLATPWLAWNARPDRKHAYLSEDQSGFVPWGEPIHVSGRSLGIRRWFPDPDVAPACREAVASGGGEAFFAEHGWRDTLQAVVAEADTGRGRPETDDEMLDRFRDEIVGARRDLSELLGRDVPHFCWPGGMYCDASWDVAAAQDFRTLTVKSRDLARWNADVPAHLRRVSAHDTITVAGRRYPMTHPGPLIAACRKELGGTAAGLELKVWKALRMAGVIR